MSSSATIRFVLDNEIVELTDVDPTRTVLQYLREDIGRKGSKEGCAEGDCGACTVVIAELNGDDDSLSCKAINSCIQFLPTLDGKQLITVESLSPVGSAMHPVQQAMVDAHASQCGFCTPGFVMSLYALFETKTSPTRREIDDALAGNLCRCTGYRPIIAAAQAIQDGNRSNAIHNTDALRSIQSDKTLAITHNGRRFYAPQTCDELATLLTEHPNATLLAGGTDVGLWVTKQHRELDTVVYTGRVADLVDVRVSDSYIDIGGGATLTAAIPAIVEHYPQLDELFLRFASPPIRNAGTLGGNIANGSPIGDSMAALMVVDATVLLRHGKDRREVALDAFYHDYMVNDLQPGEFIERIRIPLPTADTIVRCHKWSKRFDQDISAVCSAYSLRIASGKVRAFRMACGGMAATVRRASKTEATITGKPWNESTIEAAVDALADDFVPLTDMRASAAARLLACQNLLRRFYGEVSDSDLQTVYTYGR